MNLNVIYDGTLTPNIVSRTNEFRKGQFFIFDVAGLQEGEGIVIGMSLICNIPVIFRSLEKIVPNFLLETDLSLTLDSNLTYALPREVSESDYPCYLYLHSSRTLTITVYVVTSSVTQESLGEQLEEMQRDVNGIIENQIAQNNALSVLGTSLSVVTGGSSASVVPLLNTQDLVPLLL